MLYSDSTLDSEQHIQILTYTEQSGPGAESEADGSDLICIAQKETGTWHMLYNVMMLTRAKLRAILVKGK